MGLHIDNPEIERLAVELAARTGRSTVDAVELALTEALERSRGNAVSDAIAERKRRIKEIVKNFGPVPPDVTSDHSDLYDEWGLPK